MPIFLNRPDYYNLLGPNHNYNLLAQSGITGTTITTVNNGSYGSGNQTYNATFVNGIQDDVNFMPANFQLTTLYNDITGLPTTPLTYPGGPTTFISGVYNIIGPFPNNVTFTFDAQGAPTAQFIFVSNANFAINNINFNLINGANSANIYWVATNLSTISFSGNHDIFGTYIASSISVTNQNDTVVHGNLFARSTGITFSRRVVVTDEPVTACYLKGTTILTPDGYVPIEQLNIGDKIFTNGTIDKYNEIDLDNEFFLSTITWIGCFRAYQKNASSYPICFQPHSLGINCPSTTLYISPLHRIFIQGKMVEAKELVNHSTIFQDNNHEDIEYYHLELNNHSCIVANGVLTETYVDSNTRYIFKTPVACPRLVSV